MFIFKVKDLCLYTTRYDTEVLELIFYNDKIIENSEKIIFTSLSIEIFGKSITFLTHILNKQLL